MHINWLALILGLHSLAMYFCIKNKNMLGFVLYGECLIKAKNIKDRSKLENDISKVELMLGIILIIGAIIDVNIYIETFIWIISFFYAFRSTNIRKKILHGYYD